MTVALDGRRGQTIDIFGHHRNRSRFDRVFQPGSGEEASPDWARLMAPAYACGPMTRSRIQLAIRLRLVSLSQSRAMRA